MQKEIEVVKFIDVLKKTLKDTPLGDITKQIRDKYLIKKDKYLIEVDKKIVDLLILSTCKEYKITINVLLTGRDIQGKAQYARNTVLCILYIDYKQSERKAAAVLEKGRNACRVAMKYFNSIDVSKLEKFQDDKVFMEKLEKIRNQIKKHKIK